MGRQPIFDKAMTPKERKDRRLSQMTPQEREEFNKSEAERKRVKYTEDKKGRLSLQKSIESHIAETNVQITKQAEIQLKRDKIGYKKDKLQLKKGQMLLTSLGEERESLVNAGDSTRRMVHEGPTQGERSEAVDMTLPFSAVMESSEGETESLPFAEDMEESTVAFAETESIADETEPAVAAVESNNGQTLPTLSPAGALLNQKATAFNSKKRNFSFKKFLSGKRAKTSRADGDDRGFKTKAIPTTEVREDDDSEPEPEHFEDEHDPKDLACDNFGWRKGISIKLPLTNDVEVFCANTQDAMVMAFLTAKLVQKALESFLPVQKKSGLGEVLAQVANDIHDKVLLRKIRFILDGRNHLAHTKWLFFLNRPYKLRKLDVFVSRGQQDISFCECCLQVLAQLCPNWEIQHVIPGANELQDEVSNLRDWYAFHTEDKNRLEKENTRLQDENTRLQDENTRYFRRIAELESKFGDTEEGEIVESSSSSYWC